MSSIIISYKGPVSGLTSTTSGNTTSYSTANGISGVSSTGGGSYYSGDFLWNPPQFTFPVPKYPDQELVDSFRLFQLWNELWKVNPPVQKLPKDYCSSSFPACDIYEDEKNNMVLELCVAGYKEEDIEIEFEEDYLYLSLKELKDKDDSKSYLQKGIKRAKAETCYYVPFDKYDVENTVAGMDNGILTITIPMKEDSKPKKVKITTVKK
jgi:HSP20 family protein